MILSLLVSIAWQIIRVDTAGDVGSFSSLVVRDSELHIAYYDVTGNLIKYAYSGDFGNTWIFDTVLTFGPGNNLRWLSMALDTSGNPHIAYNDNQNKNLYHVYYDGTNWINQTVDNNNDVGRFCSIFIDDSNHIHIAYAENNPQRSLKYAFKRGNIWQKEYVDLGLGNKQPEGIDITVDNMSYKVHISYWDKNNNKVKYARGVFGNWGIFDVENTGTNTGHQTSIVLDSSANPHISYFRYAGQTGLKLALLNGAVFDTFYLDSFTSGINPNQGQWSSIDISQLDSLWISYYDDDIAGLKVLHYTGTKWDTMVVDTVSSNDVGRYCFLDLTQTGEPVISYYDFTSGDLILAIGKKGDVSPPGPPQNLQANGNNPSPWSNTGVFELTWVTPFDESGIKRSLYKLFSQPVSDYDTTGSLKPYSPDTVIINQEGVIPLYMWLEDSVGNTSYTSYALVNLRYDTTRPLNSVVNILPNSINQSSFNVEWTRGNDNLSGIEFYNLYYKVKGGNWTLWADSIIDTFVNFNASLQDTMYYFEVVSIDSAGNQEELVGIPEDSVFIDVSAPAPPQNLLANGSNPSPWTFDSIFVLTWTNPTEPSGISKALYKTGSRPVSNYDTTGSLNPLSPDTVYTTVEGGIWLFMWLVDGLGNVDYNNLDSVLLRHDHTPPSGAVAQTPLYSNKDTVLISWSQGQDQGGAGVRGYDVYYKDGAGPWNLLISDTNSLSAYFIGIDGHKYYFEVVSKDSAGNTEVQNMVPEDSVIFDLTPPIITSINPPDGSQNVPVNTDIMLTFSEKLKKSTVIDTNFEIEGRISGFHTFTLNYDSFNYVVNLSPQTGFASHETVFVRISTDVQDPAGNHLQGQNQFLFVTEILPDTEGPVCLTTINPSSPEPFNYLNVNVIISDTGAGNSMITYAEMFMDSIGSDGTGIPLDPVDGSYDENIEEVYKRIDLVPYNFKPGETHYIFVHAKDINNNFGLYDTIQFVISPDDDTLPPDFSFFTQDTLLPGVSFYIKGIITDPSNVYDDSTGSEGQGAYILWDTDNEIDTSYNELQLERINGDTFVTITQITGPSSGKIVYKVYAYDNDFDTQHPLDRTKGSSQLLEINFYSPMIVNLAHSPDVIYIGDSLNVEITANISFSSAPVCSLITSKGSLKEQITVFQEAGNRYKGKIITAGADIGNARIVAYYYDFGSLKRKEDTVLIKAKGEFMPENTVYVWPNPADNEGNFHFYINQNAKVKVEIFDIRGKKIMESSGIFKGGIKPHTINSNAIKLNLKNLAPGIYIFRLRAEALDTDEKKTVIKKFAIVR